MPLDPMLPIFRRTDDPCETLCKRDILRYWLIYRRARRRDDLDHRRRSYPYEIGQRTTVEKVARWHIEQLYQHLEGTAN